MTDGKKPAPERGAPKKLKIPSELAYIAAIALLSFAVAMLSAADFGISTIVAPAYLLSLRTSVLTFGQAEYVIQAGVFVVLCIVLRRFRFVCLSSFATCLIYGFVLDLWRRIPFFNPSVMPPGSMALWLRIVMFILICLAASVVMTLVFFGEFRGIGWGTIVMALINGTIIGQFSTLLDRTCDFPAWLPGVEGEFELLTADKNIRSP